MGKGRSSTQGDRHEFQEPGPPSIQETNTMEGTYKTILVKQGLVEGTMDRYCLPKKMAGQVIQDVHLTHMHIGVDGTTSQAQKFMWMPGLYTTVQTELAKCADCVQKQKIQKDVPC